ncbi:MAG: UvrD-helicase domain-containing protein [Planctomycetota bacterium]
MVDDPSNNSGRRKRKPSESTAAHELVGLFRNEVIRASAGTGKTFALSNRYLTLLASGVESQTILATTFTKKGAGEILDRIVQRLSAAALSDENAAALTGELNFKVTRKRAAAMLHDMLRNLHRLEIGTLDSFFNKIARAFSLELGLPPTWEIVEEQQMDDLRYQAISSVLLGETVIDLLHLLAKGEVRRSIDSQIYDTVSQVYRTALQSTAEDWNRLLPCNTFLSDDQLASIVDRMVEIPIRQKRLRENWHKLAGFIESENWKEATKSAFIKNVLEGNYTWSRSKLDPPVVEMTEQLIRHLRAVVTDRLIKQNTTTYSLLEQYRDLLEPIKNETGMLRFDDITDRLNEFVERPDTRRLSFRLDQHIQHLLLDEFQDTSPAQWAVVRPFAHNVTEIEDPERSFFCVGDMKQAIFGWRGGVAEIFGLVEDELDNLRRGAPLVKSYRSSQQIIDVVNNVFSKLDKYESEKRPEIDEAVHRWGEYFSHHETAKDLDGYVTIEMAEDVSVAQKQRTKSRESLDWPRNQNMYQLTVKRVQQLVQDLPEGTTIGVLARTNDVVSNLIFRLQQVGIPASEEGGTALTDSAAVNLVLSALQLADHPGDDVARFHVSHSKLGSLFDLEQETPDNQQENKQALHKGAARLRKRLVNEGYGPTVESLARILMSDCTRRELLRLQHLIKFAYAGTADAARWALRPGQFVRFIQNELTVADKSGADVRVMTIHKSKGLEFDAVVLPVKHVANGWTGRAPTVVVDRPTPTDPINIASRYANIDDRRLLPDEFQELFQKDQQREIREAMCVLYVGMTRAVHSTHVVLTGGAKRKHQSVAGILMSSLDLERKPGILFTRGNEHWFKSPSFTDKPQEVKDERLLSYYLPEDARIDETAVSTGQRSNRGIPRTSPSRLVGGNKVPVSSIFHSESEKQAMERGTLIHGCFELINWLDDGMPSHESIDGKLLELDPSLSEERRKEIAAEFHAMLERPETSALLDRQKYLSDSLAGFMPENEIVMDAYRVEADNERPFAVTIDGAMLQGFIDRLVLVYEADKLVAADIIDFKTDAVDGKTIAAKTKHYTPQLSAYRRAVSSITGLPLSSIGCQLAFVESGHVARISSPDQPHETARGMPSAEHEPETTAQKKAEAEPSKSVPPPKMQPGSKKQMRLWSDDV